MAIFTNKVFPSGGEAGHGGGIVKLKILVDQALLYYKINGGLS